MAVTVSFLGGDNRRDSLASRVAREIAQRIDGGDIKPGDRLPTERELMEEFHVSRTVIREALSSLRSSGRIATQQGRGAFVLASLAAVSRSTTGDALATLQDVLDLIDVRIGIEAEAAAMAALHRRQPDLDALHRALTAMEKAEGHNPGLDIEFHSAIATATGNRYFVEVFNNLAPMLIPRKRVDVFGEDSVARHHYEERVHLEHVQILDAIERGDPEAARSAMRLHMSNSRDRLRQKLEFSARMADDGSGD